MSDDYKSNYTGEQVDSAVERNITATKQITIEGVTTNRIAVPFEAVLKDFSVPSGENLLDALDEKQDVLMAGSNITITENTISATDTTYSAGTGISINSNNVISATISTPTWGSIEGTLNNQLDLKSALDNCQQILYSKYAISTYSSTNTYIKLATFILNNSGNNGISNLFWVEAIGTSSKNYALVKLGANWGGLGYGDTKFEILEKYGTDTSCFDTLTWAYNHTPNGDGTANIVGEIWMQIRAVSSWTYYFRPSQSNEYGASSENTIIRGDNLYTYYSTSGTSTEVASSTITSGYTQVLVTDSSTASTLSTLANQSLSNLSSTGEKHFLNKTQISNCILEDPQNINLTLSNGTLTLKAGSVVCVPNGFEADGTTPKFDEVTIESDLAQSSFGTANTDFFVTYNNTSGTASYGGTDIWTSGTTAPTGTGYFYNTTENKIYYYNAGVKQDWNFSFPVGIAKRTSGTATSIDQTFQSIGYIGSTVFVRKGLKVLIPNGLNSDGTLNNIEYTTTNVETYTIPSSANVSYYMSQSNTGTTDYWSQSAFSYNNNLNRIIHNTNGTEYDVCWIATFTATSGVISNFKPYQAVKLATQTELDAKVNKSDIYYDSSTSTLVIG